MAHIRAYFVVQADVPVTPTDEQWNDVFAAAKSYPLAGEIVSRARAAHNHITYHKRSHGTGWENKLTLISFEVDNQDVTDILAIMETQAHARGITGGTVRDRFWQTIEAEIQDGVVDAGYPAMAPNVTIIAQTYGDRETAAVDAQLYLANNAAEWYAPE